MVKITHAPSQVVLPNITGQKFNADLNPVTRKKPNSPQSALNQGGNDDDNQSITNLRLKPRLNKL